MNKCIAGLAVLAVLAGALAAAPPAQRGDGGRFAPIREMLTKYKAEDPKGYAELMELRQTDRDAFRKKVGKLMKEKGVTLPERKTAPASAAKSQIRTPDSVKAVKNIVYAQYGSRKVMLDLYLPKQPQAKKIPCIIVIHGGGWRSGNKDRFARFATALAQKGFAAACIGYRLRPEVQIRQCVEDVKASVRWVRANAETYGLDPARLGAFGGSAGAHLAAMLGTSFKEKKLEGNGGNEALSSRVHAVVAMATPADLTAFGRLLSSKEEARLISPAAFVDADSAKFLLIHAKGDRVVPYKQSLLLIEKLKGANVPGRLITINSGSHAFWNGTSKTAVQALADTVKFFTETLLDGKPARKASE